MKIEKLTDREHILRRPSMYIGGVSPEKIEDYVFDGSSLSLQALEYPPGLVKIVNEVIDNSIDAILKTATGNTVEVTFQADGSIEVKDDSAGFPAIGPSDTEEPVVTALGNARAGSNFNDEDNIGQMGTNGVGAFATNCFSKRFEVLTTSKTREVQALWEDNAILKTVEAKDAKASKTGTLVKFLPDYERFGVSETPETSGRPEISNPLMTAIYTRLACLAYTYPKIRFIFNSVELEAPKNITDWLKVNEDPYVKFQGTDYEVFVVARSSSTSNFSFVNGLNVRDGGSHLDVIMNDLAKGFQQARGFQDVSKSDIANTLQLIFVGTKFKNLRFNSQTKEKITNSAAEVRQYLGSLDSLVSKVTKSKEIKDFIKATTSAREMRANKSKLNSAKKAKIKSEKFLDAQGSRDILMLVEGDSALGGLLPGLGRKNIAYYALKGKPLNAWSSSTQKLTQNKELSELLSIIHNSDFRKIVIGTDQDLDGFHIRGLLLGFIFKYLPELLDKVYFLQTPVRGVLKDGKLVKWAYSLKDELKIGRVERAQYFKGLGSFDPEDLKTVLQTDGLEKMMSKVEIRAEDQVILEEWLGSDSQARKDYILSNDFNIAKI